MGWLVDLLRRIFGPRVTAAEIPDALEKARDRLDAGDLESAFALAHAILAAGPQGDNRVEALALLGDLHAEAGAWRRAHAEYERALALAPGDAGVLAADGEALFNLWQFDAARTVLECAVELEPDHAAAHRHLALALDRLDRPRDAEKHFRRAARLDPEEFPAPVRLSRDEFDALARKAITFLPDWVLERLQGRISFAVHDYPTEKLLAAGPDEADPQTLGLFWGEDLSRPSGSRDHVDFVPNQILLFQRNLEQFVATRDELEEEVRTTVFHEVGHYLGYDEEDLDRIGLG